MYLMWIAKLKYHVSKPWKLPWCWKCYCNWSECHVKKCCQCQCPKKPGDEEKKHKIKIKNGLTWIEWHGNVKSVIWNILFQTIIFSYYSSFTIFFHPGELVFKILCYLLTKHLPDVFECESGVRQGDVLGLNLLNIFANDLAECLVTKMFTRSHGNKMSFA